MKITKKFKYIIISVVLLAAAIASAAITYGKIKNARQQKREESYKVVRITDGLGNQMFQYALSLALANESECEVYHDLSFYGENYQLDAPTVDEMIKDQSLANKCAKRKFGLKYFNAHYKVADKEKIDGCTSHIDETVIREKGIANFNNGQHEYIHDYFETLEHFDYEKYRDIFSKEFALKVDMDEKNKDMLKRIKESNSIAIHIRRTDHGILGFTNLKYYDKAVNYMVSKIENPHFFIFSDDINWVKENFKPDSQYTVVDINDDDTNYFDFELIKNCKHQIIANSTFSWWAAWLNPNKEKIVIAPTPWFLKDERNYMMPKDWIRIQED